MVQAGALKATDSAGEDIVGGIQQEAFDVIAAGMMIGYTTDYDAAQHLARLLNERGSHMVWAPEQVADDVTRLGEHFARMVLEDRDTTLQQKWGIQQALHRRAMLWSRVGSILRKYVFCDRKIGNSMTTDGYVTGAGYSDPRMQRRAELIGNMMRWLDAAGSKALEEQVVAITRLLATGQAGTEATAGNGIDGKAFVRLTVASPV